MNGPSKLDAPISSKQSDGDRVTVSKNLGKAAALPVLPLITPQNVASCQLHSLQLHNLKIITKLLSSYSVVSPLEMRKATVFQWYGIYSL